MLIIRLFWDMGYLYIIIKNKISTEILFWVLWYNLFIFIIVLINCLKDFFSTLGRLPILIKYVNPD